jgi:hypothetical protein
LLYAISKYSLVLDNSIIIIKNYLMKQKKNSRVQVKLIPVFTLTVVILSLYSCQKTAVDESAPKQNQINAGENDAVVTATSNAMVLTWNGACAVAVARTAPLGPVPESRIYAIINIAMFDALNNIRPVYKTYALSNAHNPMASPDAAVARAAHDAIVSLLPPAKAYADSLLQVSLGSIADGDAKTRGIDLGAQSASAMLTLRANDGAAQAQITMPQGTNPGEYRSTPPFDGPPYNGFMSLPGWGKVTPFVLQSGSQFRPSEAPYALNSPEYTADFREVKRLGGAVSTARTPEQTQIAWFWKENGTDGWNRIARNLAINRNFNAWKTARLLALIQIAIADASISVMDAKYYYFFWRPFTAIRLADSDGNPDTKADTSWNVLAPPIPPIPDYPSSHACDGGAASEILINFFQSDDIWFQATSGSLPNVTRSFNSFSDAARENSLSRIYIGYHFRHAVNVGQKQGKKVGDYVFNHVLQPQ